MNQSIFKSSQHYATVLSIIVTVLAPSVRALFNSASRARNQLGHQVGRRVFWARPKIFKPC